MSTALARLLLAVAGFSFAACAQEPPAAPPEVPKLFPIQQDDKWGFIDAAGKLVVAPQYDSVHILYNPLSPVNPFDFTERVFAEGFALVGKGELFGFIGEDGREAIPPQFSGASHFYGGLAVATKDGKYGFVDRSGHFAPNSSGLPCYSYSEGLALTSPQEGDPQEFGFQDASGKIVIPVQFNDARSFHEGLAPVLDGKARKWGYIDRTGAWAVKPQFDEADYFFEGVACVAKGDKAGFIAKDGHWVVRPEYDNVTRFSEGRGAVVKDKRGGYVDATGKLVIPLGFQNGARFHEGLAVVVSDRKYGFIDRNGEWVIKPEYELAEDFSEGFAAVAKDGKCGYVDKSGKLVIPQRYDEGKPFQGGLARVRVDEKWGYIDRRGKWVWKPTE